MVAGKSAVRISQKVHEMLQGKRNEELPFEYLKRQNLSRFLREHRTGQYNRTEKALKASFDLDLKTCSLEELESIYGVGPKTARFFILHSRRDADCAVIDTHILKYLQERVEEKLPKSTPTSMKIYHQLERLFLSFIRTEFPNLTVAEADLKVWSKYAKRG